MLNLVLQFIKNNWEKLMGVIAAIITSAATIIAALINKKKPDKSASSPQGYTDFYDHQPEPQSPKWHWWVLGIGVLLVIVFFWAPWNTNGPENPPQPSGSTSTIEVSTETETTEIPTMTEPEVADGLYLEIYAGSKDDVTNRKANTLKVKLHHGVQFSRNGVERIINEGSKLNIGAPSFRYKEISGKESTDITDIVCYDVHKNWVLHNYSKPAATSDVPGYQRNIFLTQIYAKMDQIPKEGRLFEFTIEGEKWYAIIAY